MKNMNVDDVLLRMRKIYSVETNKKLGELLSLKESSISSWKSRGIPSDMLFRVVSEKGVSLDWLVYGKEEQGRELNPLENLVLTAFNQLDDNAKISILSLIHNRGVANGGIAGVSQTTGNNGINNIFSGDNLTINKG